MALDYVRTHYINAFASAASVEPNGMNTMPQTLSPPPCDKPSPNLNNMPLEILERIMALAIPRHISVTSSRICTAEETKNPRDCTWTEAIVTDLLSIWRTIRDIHKPPRKPYYYVYNWTSRWPLGLLRVCKSVRPVAGRIICARVQSSRQDSGGMVTGFGIAKDGRTMWEKFRERFEGKEAERRVSNVEYMVDVVTGDIYKMEENGVWVRVEGDDETSEAESE
ncbi:uncharacterized protein AB675_11770 [Cyphellophora attinorum]|uniref:Uncharacterized protein n=1 Tax=Cyphellophora attinorum TaxID=1664694 RepID=A0A0N1GZZ9_9EURO|nr:uncharacterized protein AB675_11770 [Phialophora attinorum]KPI36842.1 hypothetical protein AB675_11770 [Phialophora attinorum]